MWLGGMRELRAVKAPKNCHALGVCDRAAAVSRMACSTATMCTYTSTGAARAQRQASGATPKAAIGRRRCSRRPAERAQIGGDSDATWEQRIAHNRCRRHAGGRGRGGRGGAARRAAPPKNACSPSSEIVRFFRRAYGSPACRPGAPRRRSSPPPGTSVSIVAPGTFPSRLTAARPRLRQCTPPDKCATRDGRPHRRRRAVAGPCCAPG